MMLLFDTGCSCSCFCFSVWIWVVVIGLVGLILVDCLIVERCWLCLLVGFMVSG